MTDYRYGWDYYESSVTTSTRNQNTEDRHFQLVPKEHPYPPITWRIVVSEKTRPVPPPSGRTTPSTHKEGLTVQLTADQQCTLTISGQDAYGNEVEITGDTEWRSSDESILIVESKEPTTCIVFAVGPVGSAAVTVTNDVNQDGTGDYIGSMAFDVVAGVMADIEVTASEPEEKKEVNPLS